MSTGCERRASHSSRHACRSLLFADPCAKKFLDGSIICQPEQPPKYVDCNLIPEQIHPLYIHNCNHLSTFVKHISTQSPYCLCFIWIIVYWNAVRKGSTVKRIALGRRQCKPSKASRSVASTARRLSAPGKLGSSSTPLSC